MSLCLCSVTLWVSYGRQVEGLTPAGLNLVFYSSVSWFCPTQVRGQRMEDPEWNQWQDELVLTPLCVTQK